MGQKRGRAEGSFVRETRAQLVTFYHDLVQNLKGWQVRPPQIRTDSDTAAVAPASPPDILPLLPKDVDKPGTSNDDMSDFNGAAQIIANPDEPRTTRAETVHERIFSIAQRVITERGEALQILADHDPDSPNA